MADFRMLLSILSMQASIYNAIGHQRRCESCYVQYIKLVEAVYSVESIEASNALFYIGVYYFEELSIDKSLICFQNSLAVRQKLLGSTHVSCSDCLLNIGVIHKIAGEESRAQKMFEECLSIRQQQVGYSSLVTARAMEELAKLQMEQSRFVESFKQFTECYRIYTQYDLKEEMERIAALMCFLHRKIEQGLFQNQVKNATGNQEQVQLKLKELKKIMSASFVDEDWLKNGGYSGQVIFNMFKENRDTLNTHDTELRKPSNLMPQVDQPSRAQHNREAEKRAFANFMKEEKARI